LGGDEHRHLHGHTLEERIEGLAAEIVELIESGAAESRRDLRDLAIGFLRERQDAGANETPVATAARVAPFNPIALGIPLLLVGVVLLGLFPPVGLLIAFFAVVMLVWGFLAALRFR
jgi:hypothetical protein